jgi:hypothetical protein
MAVGDCVNAIGSAAANGAITATTIRIAPSNGGTCAPAVGRFGGGGFFGGRGNDRQSGGGVV